MYIRNKCIAFGWQRYLLQAAVQRQMFIRSNFSKESISISIIIAQWSVTKLWTVEVVLPTASATPGVPRTSGYATRCSIRPSRLIR